MTWKPKRVGTGMGHSCPSTSWPSMFSNSGTVQPAVNCPRLPPWLPRGASGVTCQREISESATGFRVSSSMRCRARLFAFAARSCRLVFHRRGKQDMSGLVDVLPVRKVIGVTIVVATARGSSSATGVSICCSSRLRMSASSSVSSRPLSSRLRRKQVPAVLASASSSSRTTSASAAGERPPQAMPPDAAAPRR